MSTLAKPGAGPRIPPRGVACCTVGDRVASGNHDPPGGPPGVAHLELHEALARDRMPQHATADYRLAEMTAITSGIKYGRRLNSGDFSVRLEYYQQDTKSDAPKIGVLANYDLVPSMSAVMVQFGYKFKF